MKEKGKGKGKPVPPDISSSDLDLAANFMVDYLVASHPGLAITDWEVIRTRLLTRVSRLPPQHVATLASLSNSDVPNEEAWRLFERSLPQLLEVTGLAATFGIQAAAGPSHSQATASGSNAVPSSSQGGAPALTAFTEEEIAALKFKPGKTDRTIKEWLSGVESNQWTIEDWANNLVPRYLLAREMHQKYDAPEWETNSTFDQAFEDVLNEHSALIKYGPQANPQDQDQRPEGQKAFQRALEGRENEQNKQKERETARAQARLNVDQRWQQMETETISAIEGAEKEIVSLVKRRQELNRELAELNLDIAEHFWVEPALQSQLFDIRGQLLHRNHQLEQQLRKVERETPPHTILENERQAYQQNLVEVDRMLRTLHLEHQSQNTGLHAFDQRMIKLHDERRQLGDIYARMKLLSRNIWNLLEPLDSTPPEHETLETLEQRHSLARLLQTLNPRDTTYQGLVEELQEQINKKMPLPAQRTQRLERHTYRCKAEKEWLETQQKQLAELNREETLPTAWVNLGQWLTEQHDRATLRLDIAELNKKLHGSEGDIPALEQQLQAKQDQLDKQQKEERIARRRAIETELFEIGHSIDENISKEQELNENYQRIAHLFPDRMSDDQLSNWNRGLMPASAVGEDIYENRVNLSSQNQEGSANRNVTADEIAIMEAFDKKEKLKKCQEALIQLKVRHEQLLHKRAMLDLLKSMRASDEQLRKSLQNQKKGFEKFVSRLGNLFTQHSKKKHFLNSRLLTLNRIIRLATTQQVSRDDVNKQLRAYFRTINTNEPARLLPQNPPATNDPVDLSSTNDSSALLLGTEFLQGGVRNLLIARTKDGNAVVHSTPIEEAKKILMRSELLGAGRRLYGLLEAAERRVNAEHLPILEAQSSNTELTQVRNSLQFYKNKLSSVAANLNVPETVSPEQPLTPRMLEDQLFRGVLASESMTKRGQQLLDARFDLNKIQNALNNDLLSKTEQLITEEESAHRTLQTTTAKALQDAMARVKELRFVMRNNSILENTLIRIVEEHIRLDNAIRAHPAGGLVPANELLASRTALTSLNARVAREERRLPPNAEEALQKYLQDYKQKNVQNTQAQNSQPAVTRITNDEPVTAIPFYQGEGIVLFRIEGRQRQPVIRIATEAQLEGHSVTLGKQMTFTAGKPPPPKNDSQHHSL